jgi:hypothetical protein
MPGKAIGKVFEIGYPGNITRSIDSVVKSGVAFGTDIFFGNAVVVNSDNSVSNFIGTNTAAQFAGVAVREVSQATAYVSQAPTYSAGEACDYLVRGGINVICRAGTPTAQGAVYVRVAVATADKPIGGFEAVADSTNNVLLTNAVWATGLMDADKVCELTLLRRQA